MGPSIQRSERSLGAAIFLNEVYREQCSNLITSLGHLCPLTAEIAMKSQETVLTYLKLG